MKYRSRFEIASSILKIAMEGNASKRKLMYSAYLSFAQINEYLGFLTTNGLMMVDKKTHIYSLTEKGMRFLHVYEDLKKLIPLEEADKARPAAGKQEETVVARPAAGKSDPLQPLVYT
jgi:predicted transcriptional regulator